MLGLQGVKEDGGVDVGRRMTFIISSCVPLSQLTRTTILLQGPKHSDKFLETFAEKLHEVFIQGELCIGDWSVDKGADIKVGVYFFHDKSLVGQTS